MESEGQSASENEGNSSVVLKYLTEAPLQKFYYLNIFSFNRDQENPTNLNPSLIWLPPNFFEYVKKVVKETSYSDASCAKIHIALMARKRKTQ